MKAIDGRAIIIVVLTLFVLTGVLMFQKSYALPTNIPEITKLEKSTVEDNALKVELKSNNEGSDFSLEVLNATKGTRVNVAGSTTSYTFQGLESGKEYEVMVRACSNSDNEYKCTEYSPSKKATVGQGVSNNDSNNIGLGSAILSPSSYVYDGKVKNPAVTVTDKEGTFLTNNQDYTVTYPAGRINIGSYTVTIKGKGNYSFDTKKSFQIKPAGIRSATLSTTAYTYTGRVWTPTVTVIDNQGRKLAQNTHYTVTYPAGRKNVGTYTVVVKGKGNYSFTSKPVFEIKPQATYITNLKSTTGSITVKYVKRNGGVFYQIGYKKSGTSKYAYKYTSASSYTIKPFPKNTTYNIIVRTYKKVGNKTYYSGWSPVRSIKTNGSPASYSSSSGSSSSASSGSSSSTSSGSNNSTSSGSSSSGSSKSGSSNSKSPSGTKKSTTLEEKPKPKKENTGKKQSNSCGKAAREYHSAKSSTDRFCYTRGWRFIKCAKMRKNVDTLKKKCKNKCGNGANSIC